MAKLHLFILIIFGSLGALIVSTLVHEMSHYQDFKDVAIKDIDSMCILNFDPHLTGSIGYYKFSTTNMTIVNQRDKYTEYKAYGISTIILVIFIYAVMYQLIIGDS